MCANETQTCLTLVTLFACFSHHQILKHLVRNVLSMCIYNNIRYLKVSLYCSMSCSNFVVSLCVSLIVEGKLIASFRNGSDEHCKGDNLDTYIEFQCGPEALWDTVQGKTYGDASAYFDGLIIDFEDLCSVSYM